MGRRLADHRAGDAARGAHLRRRPRRARRTGAGAVPRRLRRRAVPVERRRLSPDGIRPTETGPDPHPGRRLVSRGAARLRHARRGRARLSGERGAARRRRVDVCRGSSRTADDRRRSPRLRAPRSRDLQRGDRLRHAVRDLPPEHRAEQPGGARRAPPRVRGHDLRAEDDEPAARGGARGAAPGGDHRPAHRLPQPPIPGAGDGPRAAAAHAVQAAPVAAVHRRGPLQGDQRLARARGWRPRAAVRRAFPQAPHPRSRLRVPLGRRRVPGAHHV